LNIALKKYKKQENFVRRFKRLLKNMIYHFLL